MYAKEDRCALGEAQQQLAASKCLFKDQCIEHDFENQGEKNFHH